MSEIATGQEGSASEELRSRASKKLTDAALRLAANLTVPDICDLTGRGASTVKRWFSERPEDAAYDPHLQDVFAFPDPSIRVIRDALNDLIGEESHPIPDQDADVLDGVIASFVGGESIAFVVVDAMRQGLLEADELDSVRDAARAMMPLLVALSLPENDIRPALAKVSPVAELIGDREVA